MITSDSSLRDAILERIRKGAQVDGQAWAPMCYLVKRDNPASKAPFQLQVHGARMLAQKALYTGCHRLAPADMNTWQVQQRCLAGDGSWWCFEPTHLAKREALGEARKLKPAGLVRSKCTKHPIPSSPDAIYAVRLNPWDQGRPTKPGSAASARSSARGELDPKVQISPHEVKVRAGVTGVSPWDPQHVEFPDSDVCGSLGSQGQGGGGAFQAYS